MNPTKTHLAVLNLIHSGCAPTASLTHDCPCIIHTTFQGTLQSELKCRVCGYASITSDPFLDVSLDVGSSRGANGSVGVNGSKNGKNGSSTNGRNSGSHTPPSISPQTLDNCLKRYTHPEPSDWKCTSCSAAQASTKQLSFRKLPTVFAFQIKRYEHGLWAQKLDAPVRFPLTLNMRPYTSGDDDAEPDELYLYDLFCVINHLGEMETGHYTCASRFGEQVGCMLRQWMFG